MYEQAQAAGAQGAGPDMGAGAALYAFFNVASSAFLSTPSTS